jgi:hypothetical protein
MEFFFRYDTFSIKDGTQICFWEDSWLGNHPLSKQYPALYSISDIIAVVMATSPPDVTFRRDLIGPRLLAWNALLQRLEAIQLSIGPDKFRWNLYPNEKFSVGSLYSAIIQSDISVNNNKKIWKMKIPLKTKKMGGICVEVSKTGMEVLGVFSVIRIRRLTTYSSNAVLSDLYRHSSK